MIRLFLLSKKFRLGFAFLGSFFILVLPLYFQLKFSLNSELLNNDYSDLHLGHAISIDFWLRGYTENRNGYFATTHPGILFQISSWIVYFLSNIQSWFQYDGIELAILTLRETRSFYFISTLLSSLILLFNLFYVGKKFKFLPVLPLIGLLYGITGEYTHTFLHFTNDFFSIPLVLTWLYIWKKSPKFIETKSFYFLMGILSAFVYLNKLPYLVWLIGFVITILFFALIKSNFKMIIGLFIYIFSFLIATISVLYCFFDDEGIRAMISSHQAIISKSGRMGSGENSFLNLIDFWNNIKLFFRTNNILSTFTIFLTFLFVLYKELFSKLFRGWSIKAAFISMDPFVFWALLSFGGGLIATFKHYGYNYLLVSLAPLYLAISIVYKRKDYIVYFFIMLLIAFSVAFNGYYNEKFFANVSNQNNKLLKAYSLLPVDEKVTFVTEYRNPVNNFTAYHVLFCTDLPQINEIYERLYSNQFVYYFENPNYLNGKTKSEISEIKWDYWVTVYNREALNWHSKDRSEYLLKNSEQLKVEGISSVFIFKRKK